jgi:hypothetical protein
MDLQDSPCWSWKTGHSPRHRDQTQTQQRSPLRSTYAPWPSSPSSTDRAALMSAGRASLYRQRRCPIYSRGRMATDEELAVRFSQKETAPMEPFCSPIAGGRA